MNTTQAIAVLPFVNMSNNIENDYFCDGITEEIINALTSVKSLKVIARTSSFAFKGKNPMYNFMEHSKKFYAKTKGNTDASVWLYALHGVGYASSPQWPIKLIKLIKTYGAT